MIRLAHQIIGLPLHTIHAGASPYHISGLIVDPKELSIALFEVKGSLGGKPCYLVPSSITDVSPKTILIHSEDELCGAADLIRQRSLLELDVRLLDYAAKTTTGTKLGKVRDYSFNVEHFGITRIHIGLPLWRRMGTDTLIVARNQVVKIEHHTIIVKENRKEVRKTAPKLLPASS